MLCTLLVSQLTTKKEVVIVLDDQFIRRAMLQQPPHDGQMQVPVRFCAKCTFPMFSDIIVSRISKEVGY